MTVGVVLGVQWYKLCHKLYCDVYEAGNGYEIRFHEVEPMFGDWP